MHMSKKPKKAGKNEQDVNRIAHRVITDTVGKAMFQDEFTNNVSKIMAYMGRLGGLKGGKARAEALSSEQRKSIAKKAAKARWGKNNAR